MIILLLYLLQLGLCYLMQKSLVKVWVTKKRYWEWETDLFVLMTVSFVPLLGLLINFVVWTVVQFNNLVRTKDWTLEKFYGVEDKEV